MAVHCGQLIKRVNDILEKFANSNLQEHGVTFSQMNAMGVLSESPNESATLKELERHFGVTQSTMAGIAVRLEKKGLVISYTDAEDKRIKHIQLSDKGREICRCARKEMEENEQWLLRCLDEQEKVQLHQLLQRVCDSIQ